MPSPDEILSGLTEIANDFFALAVFWHVALAFAVGAILSRRWPFGRRGTAAILAAPLLSVSVLAWISGNPFNGATFITLVAIMTFIASRIPEGPVGRGPTWAVIVGGAVVAFGWFYPHFLESRPLWSYAIAAPTGLIPCPTLCVVLGFGLIAGGFGSRSWSMTASAAGFTYGFIGAFYLGVWIDAALLLASVATTRLAFGVEGRHLDRAASR